MTRNKKFKRRVRARSQTTLESYSQARRALGAHSKEYLCAIEVTSPFNPGWYFYDVEYPEEGSVGPFSSRESAEEHARQCDYDLEDEGAVAFFEQIEPSSVSQRYDVSQRVNALRECVKSEHISRAIIRDIVSRGVTRIFTFLKDAKYPVPPISHVEIMISEPSEQDIYSRVARVRIELLRPELYPDFVRELQDLDLLDSGYSIDIK